VCGKESKKDILGGKDKQTYKADLDVTVEYHASVPGLDCFLEILHNIHWNDSPWIKITTQPGTDGMQPAVFVIPKSYCPPRNEEDRQFAKFYKDGPKKDKFLVEYDLNHLGPELAKISRGGMTARMVSEIVETFHRADDPAKATVMPVDPAFKMAE
jgi:hypothetical protein|tara:strand:- start:9205 stop:9672 length:468 start_codon:yes stop_codon:yes gene_type:complete